ncbi:hypothetical protein NFI96_029134 [Prochilodus magdalenae]|nr:hypothetical protein NFI96_029134 [Prochilodus magdalenae]
MINSSTGDSRREHSEVKTNPRSHRETFYHSFSLKIPRVTMQSSALFLAVVLCALGGGATHVKVNTEEAVSTKCQKEVTLFCNISTTHSHVEIVEMFWMDSSRLKLCKHSDTQTPEGSERFHCHYDESSKQLALTITRPMKEDEGVYHCKLFSSNGHARGNTTLTVTDTCLWSKSEVQPIASPNNGSQATTVPSKWTSLVLLLAALSLAL